MNNLFYLLIVSERVLPFQHWRRKHRQQQNRNQEQQQRRGQMFPFQIFSAAAAETKNQMIILILVKKHKKTSAVFDHNKNSGEEIRSLFGCLFRNTAEIFGSSSKKSNCFLMELDRLTETLKTSLLFGWIQSTCNCKKVFCIKAAKSGFILSIF